MKKVATFFAIAAVVALTSCGSKSTEESTDMVDTTAVIEETAPAAMDTMPAPVDSVPATDTTTHSH